MRKHLFRMNPNTGVLLKQIGIGILVISLVVLLLVGVWHGTRVQALTISTLHIEGGETIQYSEVETKVWKALEGNYLGLIPRKFAWFFPKGHIQKVVSEIDRLYNIKITVEGGTELSITFDEYIPTALWCESVDSEDCLFVEKTGLAFGLAPKLSGGSFLRFVTSGRDLSIGQEVISQEDYSRLVNLTELLSEQNWFVSHIELDQVGDVFVGMVGGGELKIDSAQSPKSVIENLLAVITSEEFSHIKPGNFQYIDLRFGNKVFVNEEPVVLPDDIVTEVEVVD